MTEMIRLADVIGPPIIAGILTMIVYVGGGMLPPAAVLAAAMGWAGLCRLALLWWQQAEVSDRLSWWWQNR